MSIQIRLDSSLPSPEGLAWSRPLGPCSLMLRCEVDGSGYLADAAGHTLRHFPEPLSALHYITATPHAGRWVGYLSYDLGQYFEPAVQSSRSPELPLLVLSLHEILPAKPTLPTRPVMGELLKSNLTELQYKAMIDRALNYIAEGDIFQVNLAQCLYIQTSNSPMDVYAGIQSLFPAWYAALLDYGDFALISNSPELFLQTKTLASGETSISTRPIKGTRPLHPGMDQALLSSIKDQAELNMIVDLERNDLGRICQTGTVKVISPRTIETHPTLYHGSATVQGTLRAGTSLVEILRATFPGGSITGAPKIRAMQIIDELEPSTRGAYCGAIGYIDPDGTFAFNVAIRTMTLRKGIAQIPVGGGIVADSDPSTEYAETFTKASAALQAFGIIPPRLD